VIYKKTALDVMCFDNVLPWEGASLIQAWSKRFVFHAKEIWLYLPSLSSCGDFNVYSGLSLAI
jgi:hypothetical protein